MQAIGRTGGPDGPAAQKCTKAKPGKQGNPCFPFFANGFSIPSLPDAPATVQAVFPGRRLFPGK